MVSPLFNSSVAQSPWCGAAFARENVRQKQVSASKPLQVYNRARYYDTGTGEFISRDPLEYVDGMSLYRGYFATLGVDPTGTEECDEVPAPTTTTFRDHASKRFFRGLSWLQITVWAKWTITESWEPIKTKSYGCGESPSGIMLDIKITGSEAEAINAGVDTRDPSGNGGLYDVQILDGNFGYIPSVENFDGSLLSVATPVWTWTEKELYSFSKPRDKKCTLTVYQRKKKYVNQYNFVHQYFPLNGGREFGSGSSWWDFSFGNQTVVWGEDLMQTMCCEECCE